MTDTTYTAADYSTPTKDQLRKLAALANFLEDLPSERFHMPRWADDDATDTSCGTAACACGWAATIYAREGWSFYSFHDHARVPCYQNAPNQAGFSEFFGIGAEMANWITLVDRYEDADWPVVFVTSTGVNVERTAYSCETPSRSEVAERIRTVVKAYGGEDVLEAPAPKMPKAAEVTAS